MSQREREQPTSRPGAIVMSLAGILELCISVVLYGARLYPVAISFGAGALFVALIANTISSQARTMQRRRGITPLPGVAHARRLRQIAFFAAVTLGAGLVVAAVVQLIDSAHLPALTFGIWGLCCATFALRFREPAT